MSRFNPRQTKSAPKHTTSAAPTLQNDIKLSNTNYNTTNGRSDVN